MMLPWHLECSEWFTVCLPLGKFGNLYTLEIWLHKEIFQLLGPVPWGWIWQPAKEQESLNLRHLLLLKGAHTVGLMRLNLSGSASAWTPEGPALGSPNPSRRPPDTLYTDSLSWGEDKNREKRDTLVLLLCLQSPAFWSSEVLASWSCRWLFFVYSPKRMWMGKILQTSPASALFDFFLNEYKQLLADGWNNSALHKTSADDTEC